MKDATPAAAALRLEIVENRRGSVPARSRCDFAFPGGTLGRGEDNDLVLPDARQEIAQLQAILYVAHSGQHRLSNRGSLTLRLNDLPIERGQHRALAAGDTLEIGGFVLRASEAAGAAGQAGHEKGDAAGAVAAQLAGALATPLVAPLATPLAVPTASSLANPPASSATHAMAAPSSAAAATGPAAGGEVPSEIWAMLAAEFAPADARRPPPADPQHPLLQETAHEAPPSNPLLLREGAPAAAQPEADFPMLFGTDPLSTHEHILADTTPTVLAAMQARRTPIADDFLGTPLAIEPAPAGEHAIAARDSRGVLGDPLLDLLGTAPPLGEAGLAAAVREAHALPATAFASAAADEQRTALLADAPEVPVTIAEAPPAAAEPSTSSVPEAMPTHMAAQPVPLQPASTGFVHAEPAPLLPAALSQAFLEGMGLGAMQPAQLDGEHLYVAGRLLRLLSQGVIDLLAAAREDLPAPAAGEGHNPFTVFPASEGVLVQLFAQPLPGFMPAETAVERAFADLRSLQQRRSPEEDARALVGEWLDRLDPQQIQRRFEEARPRGLLPIARTSALWRFYAEEHWQLSEEAERRLEAPARSALRRAMPRLTPPQELPWKRAQ